MLATFQPQHGSEESHAEDHAAQKAPDEPRIGCHVNPLITTSRLLKRGYRSAQIQ